MDAFETWWATRHPDLQRDEVVAQPLASAAWTAAIEEAAKVAADCTCDPDGDERACCGSLIATAIRQLVSGGGGGT